MVASYLLFLLIVHLTRDKAVAALLACMRMPELICMTLVLMSCGMAGRTPLWLQKDLKDLRDVLRQRCNFAASPQMLTVVFLEVIATLFICHSHPLAIDSLLQVVLVLVLLLQFALLWIATGSAERALSKLLTLPLVSRLRLDPPAIPPSRSIGVPTPPPLALLRVA
jgi:hypothetical protein